LALEYASDELKNNKEVALIALGNDGEALEFASDELKNNKEIVLAAVHQNGIALPSASDGLINDPSVVGEAVSCPETPYLLWSWVGDDLKGKLTMVLDGLQGLEDACEDDSSRGSSDSSSSNDGGASFSNQDDVLLYARARENVLLENIWLILSRAPLNAGGGEPLSAEIKQIILQYSAPQGELQLMRDLVHCAPVIGALAEIGVPWENIDVEDDSMF